MTASKKVFIFDDNTDILELCTIILEDAGYEIKTSSTSNDIIAQVNAYVPDIIFMDNWLSVVGVFAASWVLWYVVAFMQCLVIYFFAFVFVLCVFLHLDEILLKYLR